MWRLLPTLLAAAAVAIGCDDARREATNDHVSTATSASLAADTWIHGSVDERFAQVAKHLRGFDVAMVETGYRYGELYWAGRDRNWEYALYQLGKIETAVANGVERRPKRASSARMLDAPLRAMKAVLEARDVGGFEPALANLTSTCNACHAAEQVAFIRIVAPTIRASPVAAVAAPGGVP
jgi:hypothetical protein